MTVWQSLPNFNKRILFATSSYTKEGLPGIGKPFFIIYLF